MINILLPIGGLSEMSEKMGYPYPAPLIELHGRPMIERVVDNLKEVASDCRFIFVLREDDCKKFHLDNIVKLLAPESSIVIKLNGDTKGALCSALMAVPHINNNTPLIVANSDQLFDAGVLGGFIHEMETLKADAGSPFFESVHPRWSYFRMNDSRVVEVAEKDPISRNAVAGLYYFCSGELFVNAAKRAILNSREISGSYYISAAMNELILDGLRVVGTSVSNDKFHSFFTPQRVEEYERLAV